MFQSTQKVVIVISMTCQSTFVTQAINAFFYNLYNYRHSVIMILAQRKKTHPESSFT